MITAAEIHYQSSSSASIHPFVLYSFELIFFLASQILEFTLLLLL